jgi:hypothetical protein
MNGFTEVLVKKMINKDCGLPAPFIQIPMPIACAVQQRIK